MRSVTLKFSGGLLFLSALLCCVAATKSDLGGPTLGFLAVGDSELRPILGIAGAAHLGAAIPLPSSVTKLYIAPGSRYALLEQSEERPPGVVELRVAPSGSDAPTVSPIQGALPPVDATAFSPTGQAVVIYVASANLIEVITGLPNAPAVTGRLSTAAISGTIFKLAVSDDGAAVLAADLSSVYSLRADVVPAVEFAGKRISAMAFFPNSHDAVACDRSQNIVTLLRWIGSNFEASTLSTSVSDPEAVASTYDGQTVLITGAAQAKIWAIDRSSGSAKDYPLEHASNQLTRLTSNEVFLLSPKESSNYWVLSWRNAGPSTSFIGGTTN